MHVTAASAQNIHPALQIHLTIKSFGKAFNEKGLVMQPDLHTGFLFVKLKVSYGDEILMH